MYKAGDEVLIKGRITSIDEGSIFPYLVEVNHLGGMWCNESDIADKAYSDGLKDAWEMASKIVCHESAGGMSDKVFCDVFGAYGGFESVFADLTYEEALAKIEAYEKEKEIKVGYVVEDEEGTKALVIDESTENTCFVFTENGCVEEWYKRDLKKTGKHIDIESLLRQIGE